MRRLVKQLRNGQITIPKEFREALQLRDDDMLAVELRDGKLEVEPVRVEPKTAGSPWVKEMHALFAPVRDAASGEGADEVNAAIDEALEEVRSRKA